MSQGKPSLDRAMSEIAEIRGQMARATEFRGYGAAAVAGTAVLAVLAALGQPRWAPAPVAAPGAYAAWWSGAAAIAAALIGAEAVARAKRLHGGLADEMIRAAMEQFLPAAIAGLLTTWALVTYAPASARLLPGVWQVIFSLGVFATCRILPRPVLAVGAWYLATGLACIAAAGRDLAPWMMGAPFAVGQAMAAAIIWKTKERDEERSERDGAV
jgi:hypothetical protein